MVWKEKTNENPEVLKEDIEAEIAQRRENRARLAQEAAQIGMAIQAINEPDSDSEGFGSYDYSDEEQLSINIGYDSDIEDNTRVRQNRTNIENEKGTSDSEKSSYTESVESQRQKTPTNKPSMER